MKEQRTRECEAAGPPRSDDRFSERACRRGPDTLYLDPPEEEHDE